MRLKLLIQHGKKLLKRCDRLLREVSKLNAEIYRLDIRNTTTDSSQIGGAFNFWNNEIDDVWNEE